MITLAKDCLLFRLANGETVPFSADMITVELTAETARWIDPEIASHAAKAVFYYFKSELGRQTVTAEEFSAAMERALRGLAPGISAEFAGHPENGVIESDLCRLAQEAGEGGELLFFPRLRSELRDHLQQSPRLVHYRGLRACVKQITRARRWSSSCRYLEEQIVDFLRECAGAETGRKEMALVVE